MFIFILAAFAAIAAVTLQLLAIPAIDCQGFKIVFQGVVIALTVVSVMLVKLALSSALIMGV